MHLVWVPELPSRSGWGLIRGWTGEGVCFQTHVVVVGRIQPRIQGRCALSDSRARVLAGCHPGGTLGSLVPGPSKATRNMAACFVKAREGEFPS